MERLVDSADVNDDDDDNKNDDNKNDENQDLEDQDDFEVDSDAEAEVKLPAAQLPKPDDDDDDQQLPSSDEDEEEDDDENEDDEDKRERRQKDKKSKKDKEDDDDEDQDDEVDNEDGAQRKKKRKKKLTSQNKKKNENDDDDEDGDDAAEEFDEEETEEEKRRHADESVMLWRRSEACVEGLAQQLCEQLRLILTPTVADKLEGDFKSGKRLNMKKVVQYIASNYRKDRIWMRRSKPNKRSYQIMIAIDNSQSMKLNRIKIRPVPENFFKLLSIGSTSLAPAPPPPLVPLAKITSKLSSFSLTVTWLKTEKNFAASLLVLNRTIKWSSLSFLMSTTNRTILLVWKVLMTWWWMITTIMLMLTIAVTITIVSLLKN